MTSKALGTTEMHKHITIKDAWFGANIRRLMAQDIDQLRSLVLAQFRVFILSLNANHPWRDKPSAMSQVDEILEFDHSWTLEDVVLFLQSAGRGDYEPHYGRPNRAWIRECQIAYNDKKFEAREEIALQAKKKAEADAAEKAYYMSLGMDLPTAEGRMERVRTMAEFLGGKNKLTPAERAEMLNRDKERKDGAAE